MGDGGVLMRWTVALLLAACGGGGGGDVEPGPDAGPAGPDAMPAGASVERCKTVGEGFCDGERTCRIGTSPGCAERWFFYHCKNPEPMNDAEADECANAFRMVAANCTDWWAKQWWEYNAPTCAELVK